MPTLCAAVLLFLKVILFVTAKQNLVFDFRCIAQLLSRYLGPFLLVRHRPPSIPRSAERDSSLQGVFYAGLLVHLIFSLISTGLEPENLNWYMAACN